jgi:hypothetical protein
LPVAVHVLKSCGLYGVSVAHGPIELEDAAIVGGNFREAVMQNL